MKKLLLSVALGLAAGAHAYDVNVAATVTAKTVANVEVKGAFLVGQDSTTQALRAIPVDANGNITVNTTSTANTTVGGYVWLSGSAYTATSHTVSSINLTSVAAYAGPKPIGVLISSIGAATAVRWAITNSSTPPSYLSSSVGHYQAASTTAIAPFDCATNGQSPFLHLYGVAASATTVIDVFRKE